MIELIRSIVALWKDVGGPEVDHNHYTREFIRGREKAVREVKREIKAGLRKPVTMPPVRGTQ